MSQYCNILSSFSVSLNTRQVMNICIKKRIFYNIRLKLKLAALNVIDNIYDNILAYKMPIKK